MTKQKNHLSDKELTSKQEIFCQSLEGIGDVLVFETKRRNKNKNIIEGLKKIENIIITFIENNKNGSDQLDSSLLAQHFYNGLEGDEIEAQLRLASDTDKYLMLFSTAINQIIRIHEAAIEAKNDYISRFATYHLIYLLAYITKSQNNERIVELSLENMSEVTRIAIGNRDDSMYASSIHWYTDIVFNTLGENYGVFDLSYLNLFDMHFFSTIKYIISQNQTSLFKSLISTLEDGVSIHTLNSGKVFEYQYLILQSSVEKYNQRNEEHQLEKCIVELAKSENDLDTIEKLDKWLKKFDELKKISNTYFVKEQKNDVVSIEEDIRDFVNRQFKYNNLIEIIFGIGSYCLFKQRSEYIKYFWEYKQPLDSDGIWIGDSIVPRTIDGVVNFYFRKGLFERKFNFFGEGHHGSEKYYKEYFLLLLARSLQSVVANSEGIYEQIENYNLSNLPIYRLTYLERSIDGFIEIARELKTQKDTLNVLDFDVTTLDELFDKKLVPFLNGLKLKAQEQIKNLQRNQQMSKKKISEFNDDVIKGFNELASLRCIFEYYNLYDDQTDEKYEGNLKQYGIKLVDSKAIFFDEWHVHYGDIGAKYGRNLASGENSELLEDIIDQCNEIKNSDFEKILEQHQDLSNVIIFATRVIPYTFFENLENFKPKWHSDILQLDIHGFEGYYSFNGIDIPIFEIYHKSIDKQILILNKNRLGTLIQQSPLNEGDNEELKNNHFYINVQAFSENKELMDKSIQDAQEWLQKIGNEKQQREYLQERVLIHISERFEYIKPKEFEGYLLKLTD